jgi:hypothetical protein
VQTDVQPICILIHNMTLKYCIHIKISFSVEKVLEIKFTIYLSMALQSLLLDRGCFFSFLILYRVGRTPRTGDQPVVSPPTTHRTTQTQNKGTQTSMPRMEFETTIPVLKRTKTLRPLWSASDLLDTIIHVFVFYKLGGRFDWQLNINLRFYNELRTKICNCSTWNFFMNYAVTPSNNTIHQYERVTVNFKIGTNKHQVAKPMRSLA